VDIQFAAWREQMLNRLLPLTSAIATVGVAVGVISVFERGKEIYIPIYVGAWILLVMITFIRRLTYYTRAAILLALIAILGVTVLSETGLSGDGRSFLIVLPIAAMVLLNWQYSLIAMALSVGILLLFGALDLPQQSRVETSQFSDWLLSATLVTMLTTGVVISLRAILENLMTTLKQELRARQELRELSDHWEKTVNRRTQELKRSTALVKVLRELFISLNSQRDPNRLLHHVASFLGKEFKIDHVSFFMLEPDGELANLRAAAGNDAERWLVEGRAAKAGDKSLVGWCMQQGRGRLITSKDERIPPVLAESGSALGMPMRVADKIVGVLVLQTVEPGAFTEDDMTSWQEAADEIARAAELASIIQAGQSDPRMKGGPQVAGAPRFAALMRDTLDVESVIRTAAEEIGEAMGLAAVEVRLGIPPTPPDAFHNHIQPLENKSGGGGTLESSPDLSADIHMNEG
jgi:hypothetical protein